MLQAMQQPAPSQPSSSLSSFAGLLATLASPRPSPPSDSPDDAPLWNSSDLGEDVVSLSYEQALRARARYRSAYRSDGSPIPPGGLGLDAVADAVMEGVAADPVPVWEPAPAPDRDLRSASVTVRMSKAECERLHRRAAEAGLTVSAYLRSCALEAETLRAQVKQALAELKAGTEPTRQAQTTRPPVAQPAQGTRELRNRKTWRLKFLEWIRWLTRGR
ncbi:MAG: hypothetical protein P4K93_03245 [Terracidiphilus sp.]|nr:hypothetical protein [Terracidiphilus sp.]MDR3797140.1 hypothetical protein [Terracidiphilus sp.]